MFLIHRILTWLQLKRLHIEANFPVRNRTVWVLEWHFPFLTQRCVSHYLIKIHIYSSFITSYDAIRYEKAILSYCKFDPHYWWCKETINLTIITSGVNFTLTTSGVNLTITTSGINLTLATSSVNLTLATSDRLLRPSFQIYFGLQCFRFSGVYVIIFYRKPCLLYTSRCV